VGMKTKRDNHREVKSGGKKHQEQHAKERSLLSPRKREKRRGKESKIRGRRNGGEFGRVEGKQLK